jgi:hypothetical protein
MENRLEEALGVLGPIVIWFGRGGDFFIFLRKRLQTLYRNSSPRSIVNCFCLHAGTWLSAAVKHRQARMMGSLGRTQI